MTENQEFHTITINRISDFRAYNKKGRFYRGQSDKDWPISTTLERLCFKMDGDLSHAVAKEEQLLLEFKRRFHHYDNRPPDEHDDIEWLSIMQHFGAPTRLSDWTKSFCVAAYFALENADKDCVVWALNGEWAKKATMLLHKKHGIEQSGVRSVAKARDKGAFRKQILESRIPFVAPVRPFRLNERLALQQGLFMTPGDLFQTFEENLKALPDWQKESSITRVILPMALRQKALKELYEVNITRATLFPGLDGFAQSLRIYHPDLVKGS